SEGRVPRSPFFARVIARVLAVLGIFESRRPFTRSRFVGFASLCPILVSVWNGSSASKNVWSNGVNYANGVSRENRTSGAMKITEALMAEHLVFHNMFDQIEATAQNLKTLAELKAVAAMLGSMLKVHADTEDTL